MLGGVNLKEVSYKNIDELFQKNRVFYNFSLISKIPRGSFFEKEISNYLVKWANEKELEVSQDKHYNLLIRKAASIGYENKKPIILQAHMDMVCEKMPNVEHDFRKDSIKFELVGDILSTGNRTTLGADDGIGMALAMTVLEDKNLKHPPIDVIFTTAEEEDMSGALNISAEWFFTNRLINLDHVVDNEVIVGSSGGKGVELEIPLSYINKEENQSFYEIKVLSLKGGHSGEDINKGLGNANIILVRLLKDIFEKIPFVLSDIKGGNFRLAIPREARAVIAINEKNTKDLKKIVSEFKDKIKKVYASTEKKLDIEIVETNIKQKLVSEEITKKILNAIFLSPNGISGLLNSEIVESSCNLGEIYFKDDCVHMITEIRATYEINREYIYKKLVTIADIFEGKIKEFAVYPSWTYIENSDLKNLAISVYKEIFREDLKTLVVHAGLECGCFSEKIKNMDAISLGPNTWNLHSPYEKVSISSTNKIYKYLIEILKKLD